MEKNWLIRTKSNHILGPVSKEKVIELYQNGSIKSDDEICSGNGYWFFIRESDLIQRYLLGKAVQSFNPISEAKDVLTSSNEDSDYPDVPPVENDITMVGGIDLRKLKEPESSKPDYGEIIPEVPIKLAPSAQKKKLKSDSEPKTSGNFKQASGQSYLQYAGIFIFIVLFLVIYFRKTILKTFFHRDVYHHNLPSLIISSAYAQDDASPGKKKSF